MTSYFLDKCVSKKFLGKKKQCLRRKECLGFFFNCIALLANERIRCVPYMPRKDSMSILTIRTGLNMI